LTRRAEFVRRATSAEIEAARTVRQDHKDEHLRIAAAYRRLAELAESAVRPQPADEAPQSDRKADDVEAQPHATTRYTFIVEHAGKPAVETPHACTSDGAAVSLAFEHVANGVDVVAVAAGAETLRYIGAWRRTGVDKIIWEPARAGWIKDA
jgi:acetyl-CoA acetyltransferase